MEQKKISCGLGWGECIISGNGTDIWLLDFVVGFVDESTDEDKQPCENCNFIFAHHILSYQHMVF